MQRPPLFRALIVLIVALIGFAGSGLQATAQDATGEPIVGAWLVTVSVDGAPHPFTVLYTFESGGTVTSENLPVIAADPTAPVDTLYLSTGVGAWERTDSGSYAASIVIMYGGIDGTLLAVETVSWDVMVDASGTAFSGSATFVTNDPAGNQIFGGTSVLTGTRITVQETGVPVGLPAPAPATPAA